MTLDRLEIEAMRTAINDLLLVADAIEDLAFKMPSPNDYTPQFVMIANTARRLAAESDNERRERLGLSASACHPPKHP